MSQVAVTVVRVYLVEGRDPVTKILKRLQQKDCSGFTVFRGVQGLGGDHRLHKASLLDVSASLPIVIEFLTAQNGWNRLLRN